MKEQKKLKHLGITNCFMTPAILAQILGYVETYLKTNPPNWDNEIQFMFDQSNSKKFLENDETRKILYDFLNKQKDTEGLKLDCYDEFEPMTDWRWTDGILNLWYKKVLEDGSEGESVKWQYPQQEEVKQAEWQKYSAFT